MEDENRNEKRRFSFFLACSSQAATISFLSSDAVAYHEGNEMIFRLFEGYFRDLKVDRSMSHHLLRCDVIFSSKHLLDNVLSRLLVFFLSVSLSLSVAEEKIEKKKNTTF